MDQYLTAKDVAEILVISPVTLARWRKEHPEALPFTRLGRQIRYSRTAVENFIQSQSEVA